MGRLHAWIQGAQLLGSASRRCVVTFLSLPVTMPAFEPRLAPLPNSFFVVPEDENTACLERRKTGSQGQRPGSEKGEEVGSVQFVDVSFPFSSKRVARLKPIKLGTCRTHVLACFNSLGIFLMVGRLDIWSLFPEIMEHFLAKTAAAQSENIVGTCWNLGHA